METCSKEKSGGGIFSTFFTLPIRHASLIHHINGLLWLRIYPASIAFTALISSAFIFIMFAIGGSHYTHLAFAGSLVSAAAGYGLAAGNNIIDFNWIMDYKMQISLSLYKKKKGIGA